MKLAIENKIRIGFGLALLSLLLTSAAAYWSATRSVETFKSVEHTERILNSLRRSLAGVLDVENGTRGFVITENKRFLSAFTNGQAEVNGSLDELRLATQHSKEREDLQKLEFLVAQEISSASNEITLKRGGSLDSTVSESAGPAERESMKAVRGLIHKMESAEEDLLTQRSAETQVTFETTLAVVGFSGALAVLVVGVASAFAHVDFRRRRQAEEERDRFFLLSRDLLCFADFDGRFQNLNPAWQTVLGFTAAELMARPFIEFVHPDDRDETTAEFERLLKGDEVIGFENRYRTSEGSYRWLSWNARASLPQKHIYATARDVTEQKQAIEQIARLNTDLQQGAARLTESEERFRMMIDSAREYAIFMLDAQGTIASWNPGAERIKGYCGEEIVGRHFSRFYLPEDIEQGKPKQALEIAAKTGRYQDSAWRIRKDGSRFWADVVMTPVRDSSGQLRGFVKITRDVTEHREAEEKIRNLNKDLQRRARELEEANRELEAFSYSVSHDLRAPLRHIDGFVGLLAKTADGALDQKGRRYLNIISESARQMGMLIDDLLVFSRMGRTEMHNAKVNLNSVVRETIARLQHEASQREIEWICGALPTINGDPSMIRQVFVNLLENAVKYTSTRARAKIEIGATEDPNESVVFVRDNGVGFEMEYSHKLFGVFQRLHRTEEFEGTGIGLANVRRIIHRHHGRTWAEGKVGHGATFYFSLPKNPETT